MSNHPLRIMALRAENFKKISVVEINPTGNVVVLTGKNGQGKSSVLDLIEAALGGKNADPKKPIKTGAKKSTNSLALGDGTEIKYVIKKNFTENGSYTTVETDSGAVLKSPQSFLDTLVKSKSFDPLEWVTMKDKVKQRQVLLDLAGVKTDDLDVKHSMKYQERTNVGRDLKNAQGALVGKVFHKDAPAAEVSVAELSKQLNEATIANNLLDKEGNYVDQLEKNVETAATRVKDETERIAELEKALSEAKAALKIKTANHAQLKKDHQKAAKEFAAKKKIDTAPIQAQIDTAEEDNKKVRENAEYLALKKTAEAHEKTYRDLTDELAAIETEKRQRLAAAKMPIAGLTVTENEILYNDEPLEQASSGEQTRVGMAVGMALNPGLHVLMSRNGSLLDSDNLKVIEEMAGEHNFQIWIEKVDESGKIGIYLEDGSVAAVNE